LGTVVVTGEQRDERVTDVGWEQAELGELVGGDPAQLEAVVGPVRARFRPGQPARPRTADIRK
jgi:hypothetical protein